MPRATFFNDASHASATRTEYERIGRRYCVAVHKARQDDLEPDLGWLADYFLDIRRRYGKSVALRQARAIGHHMRIHGKENLCDRPEIEVVLYAADSYDPIYRDVPDGVPVRLRKRAQYFMESAYSAGTLDAYHREIVKWASRREVSDAADLERCGEDDVLSHLQEIADGNSGHHVRNVRNAMSHFFRSRKLPDMARTERVNEFVRSKKCQKGSPLTTPTAYTQEERRRLVAPLGDGAADVRDRDLLIICGFSRYCPETAVAITAEACKPEGDGYCIKSEDPGRYEDTFIGGCDDPDFDIRIWLPKLTALVKRGPLFQAMTRRGNFSGVALSPTAAQNIFHRARRLSGLAGNPIRRLQRTFRQTVIAQRGPTPVAKQLGIKRIENEELRISERGRATRIEAKRRRPKVARLYKQDFDSAPRFRH